MSKKFNIFLSALFCTFLGGMLVISTILPDKTFSDLENRNLSKTPQFSIENFTNGEFMSDAEEYVSDHILGRDLWVSIKSWCERLLGKQENNGVYFGAEGTLINRLDTPDLEKLEQDMVNVDKLVSNTGIPVYFGLIPSSAEIWKDRLPTGAPTADEKFIIDQLYGKTRADVIDLYGALSQHKDEGIYYRTDHHWTSLGAYYGYAALMETMGLDAPALETLIPTTVTEDFNGTIFSSSGVRWLKPDTIEIYIPEEGVEVTRFPAGKPVEGQLYDESFLEKKDKYSYFLGGVQPLCTIKTQNTEAPKLLLIRDSYSDSLAPFLTQNFSEIHLWDLRYNLNSLQEYIAQNEIDNVVVLYSIANFVADKNLFLLGR